MFAPETAVRQLLDDIESGAVNSLTDLDGRFAALHGDYPRYEWTWAAEVLQKELGKSIDQVTVTDVNDGKEIWKGEVPKGGIHTLTLKGQHVKVVSDTDVCVQVAPYEHYKGGYAEHHFGTGGEGSGEGSGQGSESSGTQGERGIHEAASAR